jgi:hypothetical protein
VSIVFLITSCELAKSTDQNDLEGVWQAIANDTIYSEVIFSNEKMHSTNNGEGNMLMISHMIFAYSNMTFADHLSNYKIENDTLKIINGSIVQPAFKIAKVNDHEYIGYNPAFTTRLIRIKDDKEILKGFLSDTLSFKSRVFSDYLQGFRSRKEEWENLKKK